MVHADQVAAEPALVIAYPVQELAGDAAAVAYPVARGYYPEPMEGKRDKPGCMLSVSGREA